MVMVLDQLLTHVVRRESLHEKDTWGWAPLHILAQNKAHEKDKCDMLSLLLEAEADPTIRGNRGATPLFKAASTAAKSQLQLLLASGVDPNEPNDEGTTPLDASWANRECKQLLVQSGGHKGDGGHCEREVRFGRKRGFSEDGGGVPGPLRGPEKTTRRPRSGCRGEARRDSENPKGWGSGAKPDARSPPEGCGRAKGTASRSSSRPPPAGSAG